MFFKKKISASEKGERVGYYLPGYATLLARELASHVPQINKGGYQEGSLDLLLELISFYMHVANRLAFRDLGREPCAEFSKSLIVAVANNVTTSLNRDLSSVPIVAELRDKYNERERYYAQFHKVVPAGDDPPKNTLFWEFGKVIFNRFVETNDTADLVLVQDVAAPDIAAFLKKTNEVLKM